MPELKSDPNAPSCRLQVLLARDAPVGVIFRRGPSKWVRLIGWNTSDDTFLLGQWFHGRIYENDSDLTPDGRYLVYHAGKYTGNRTGNHHAVPINRAWTAVSRPPYLTALALWQNPYGGTWESNTVLRLSFNQHGNKTHPDFPLPPHIQLSQVNYPPEEKSYGWSALLEGGGTRGWQGKHKFTSEFYRLTQTVRDSGSEQFAVQHLTSPTEYPLPQGTCWAGWDQQGRLIWAKQSKLWAVWLPVESPDKNPLADATLLADFTAMTWEDVPAPDWATRW